MRRKEHTKMWFKRTVKELEIQRKTAAQPKAGNHAEMDNIHAQLIAKRYRRRRFGKLPNSGKQSERD